MNAVVTREFEEVARAVAQWGSLAAAVLFGVGFVTDRAMSYHLVIGEVEQIVLVSLVFAGYWLAWRQSCELCGSVLALVAVGAYWAWCRFQNAGSPSPYFLAVALPALFHLTAVAFHRLWSMSGSNPQS